MDDSFAQGDKTKDLAYDDVRLQSSRQGKGGRGEGGSEREGKSGSGGKIQTTTT